MERAGDGGVNWGERQEEGLGATTGSMGGHGWGEMSRTKDDDWRGGRPGGGRGRRQGGEDTRWETSSHVALRWTSIRAG